jgi:hypothetical protein
VLVTVTLDGSPTSAEITNNSEALCAAIAESMQISEMLVQLVTVQNARRRLLAMDLTFRVLAEDSDQAQRLKDKFKTADIQVYAVCTWWLRVKCKCCALTAA